MRYLVAITLSVLVWLPLSGEEVPAWAVLPYFASPPPVSTPPESSVEPGGTSPSSGTEVATGAAGQVEWSAPEVLAMIFAEAGVIGLPQMDPWTPLWLEWQAAQEKGYQYVTDEQLQQEMTQVLLRAKQSHERRERIRSRRYQ